MWQLQQAAAYLRVHRDACTHTHTHIRFRSKTFSAVPLLKRIRLFQLRRNRFPRRILSVGGPEGESEKYADNVEFAFLAVLARLQHPDPLLACKLACMILQENNTCATLDLH